MEMRRFIQAGAILAEDFTSQNSIEDLERRGWLIGDNPQITDEGIDFDGADDFLREQPNNSAETIYKLAETNEITFFMKGVIGTKTSEPLSLVGSWQGASKEFLIDYNATSTRFEVYNEGSFRTSLDWTNDSQEHVFVITCKNSAYQLYVDGTLVDSTTDSFVALTPAAGAFLTIGQQQGDWFFDGSIKQVILFNRILSSQEITDLTNGTTFDYDKYLVARYDMSSVNPIDLSGNGNDATGSGITSSDIVSGINGKSNGIAFTSTKAIISSISNPEKANFIFATSGANEVGRLFDKGDYPICFISGQDIFYNTRFSGDDPSWNTTSNLIDGTFRVIGISYDNSSADNDPEIYIDSVKQTINEGTTPTGTVENNSNNFYFGNRSTGDRSLGGSTSSILIYSGFILTNLQHADINNRIRRGEL